MTMHNQKGPKAGNNPGYKIQDSIWPHTYQTITGHWLDVTASERGITRIFAVVVVSIVTHYNLCKHCIPNPLSIIVVQRTHYLIGNDVVLLRELCKDDDENSTNTRISPFLQLIFPHFLPTQHMYNSISIESSFFRLKDERGGEVNNRTRSELWSCVSHTMTRRCYITVLLLRYIWAFRHRYQISRFPSAFLFFASNDGHRWIADEILL